MAITVSSGTTNVTTATTSSYTVLGSGTLDILSGGTVAGTIAVSSGGVVSVGSGGSATSTTTVSNGGSEIILSGGTVQSAVVNSAGTETVVAGGVLTSATVSAGGTLAVSGGTVSNTLALAGISTGTKTFSWPAGGGTSAVQAIGDTVASGGTQVVSSGGTAVSTTISSGGTQSVLSGGKASATIVLAGGGEKVSSGGTATSAIVSSGGTETVIAGGAETTATVYAGGTFAVSGGLVTGVGFTANTLTLAGVATSKTFSWTSATSNGGTSAVAAIGETAAGDSFGYGGTINVSSGGSASNTQITSSGVVNVYASGVTRGDLVSSGGTENVSSGGVASATVISSGGTENVSSGGVASGVIVAGGAENVLLGGSASATTVLGGGTEIVSSGGSETSGTVSSGGSVVVVSGDVLNNVTLSAGANLVVSGGTISGAGASITVQGIGAATVVSGTASALLPQAVVLSGQTVTSGATVTVSSGGGANGLLVIGGGGLIVASGGRATSDSINSGGSATIQSGGLASAATINQTGTVIVSSGGVVSGASIYGAEIVLGIDSGATVGFAGTQTVSAGGSANAATVNGGTEIVTSGGLASGTKVGTGALVVSSGGSAAAAILSGGAMTIASGGSATSTTVSSTASVTIASGGVATLTTVSSGGVETVSGAANTTSVLAGGTEVVGAGGVESGGAVNSGGVELVAVGGTLSNVTLSAGAILGVSGGLVSGAGATLSLAPITATEVVSLPGAASYVEAVGETVSAGGLISVSSGGITKSSIIGSGGSETVLSGGVASASVITNGGSQTVSAGGVASGTILSSGGAEAVSSGGTVSGVNVSSGGVETISSGGSAINGTISSGGLLTVVSGGALSSVYANGGVFEVSGFSVGSTGSMVLKGGAFFNWSPTTGGTSAVEAVGETVSSGGKLIVSSGGIDSGGEIMSGATVSVLSGGTLSNVAFDPGSILVVSGGSVSGAGASLTLGAITASSVISLPSSVASATSALGVSVSSGGTITVSSGGYVSGISEGSGGALVVSSGGIASGGLAQGGTVTIGTGGSGLANQIQNGGSLLVSGGTETSASIAFANLGPAVATVEAGGITSKSFISQGGVETVSAGGLSISATTDQLGSQFVLSGGSAVSATIEGLQVVSSGGFVSATKLMSGFPGYSAVLMLAGSAAGVSIVGSGASAVVLAGGSESGGVVSSGATQVVSSGGSTTGTTVLAGGRETVSSSASATGTTVSSGGSETVYLGATLSNATYNAGANLLEAGAVVSGATVSVATLTAQEVVNLAPGGAIPNVVGLLSATVTSGGLANVGSGGLFSASTVGTGGSAVVYSGGLTSGVTLVAGGAETVLGSGSAYGTTISSGGTLQVSSGGVASGGVVGASGTLNVAASGSVVSATLSSGGNIGITAGAVVSGIQVASGASLVVSSGITVSNSYVSSGGLETVFGTEVYNLGGAFGVVGGSQTISSGGVASGENMATGGTETVASSGLSISAIANNGGTISVGSGGTATSARVFTGGTEDVLSGGSATNLVVSSGGSEIFWVGANVSATTISAGAKLIEGGLTVSNGVGVTLKPLTTALPNFSVGAGGTSSGLTGLLSATVLGGGTVTVSSGGTTTGTILSGGTETVSAGGSAGLGTILSGGYEDILSGGSLVTSETVGAGGTLELAAGAVSSAAIVFTSAGPGTAAFDSATGTSASITGFAAGDQIALGAFTAPITGATLVQNGAKLQLTITDGPQSFVVPNVAFAPGLVSGTALDGYQFVFDTALVNGATDQAVTVAPIQATVSVSGTAQEGQVLTAVAAVAGDSDETFTYQWQSSSDGGNTWLNIVGATGSTYTVAEADETNLLQVTVVAENGASASSLATAAVIDIAPALSVPVIAGTAQEGQTLTASAAAANDADATVGYQWQSSADGTSWSPIAGATSLSYQVAAADAGKMLRVEATSSDPDGSGTTADSLATPTVTYAAPMVSVPVIGGTAQEGQTLTASAAAGSGDTLSYAWFAGATQVGSGASYVVKEADEASTITVQATATNRNNVSASQTSAPSSSVIDIAPALSVPVIAGTAQEGQTLTASAAAANDADATVGYQWQSSADGTSWSPIAGATSLSYQVAAADAGKMLRVEATSSDPDGSGTTADSLATPTVTYAAPTVSVPVIGGTAQEGQTLTASATAGSGDTLSYAWFAGATQVGSGASYVVKEADEASTITVQATATNGNNVSASQTSAPSSSVIDIAPALSVPVIAGTAQEGQTLTASAAAANDADATVGYQWQSSADGTSWSPIAGATSLSYQVAAADAGKMLRVEATSSDPDGSGTTADSLATATVTYAAPTVSVPVIAGTAQEGQTLTASATAGSGDTLSYAWFAGATQVGSGASYVVKEADEASTITVQATATNGNNVSASQTSAPSSSVIDIAPALSVPVIAGTAQEGQTLTASAAAANDADATVGYQWQSSADGTSWSPIAGATSLSYQVAAADAGKMLRVEATSSDPDGSGTTADSLATATVTYAAPTVSVPVIGGTAQEGQTLTASATAGSGDTLSYAWFAGATQVGSGASYVVKEADEASTITVQATATNGNNVSASQTSAPSSSVIDIAPALSVPVIAGTAQEGQTLTASAAAANDADATVGYQWQSSADGTSWSPIAGATSLSYQVAAADAGKMLRVEATSSDPDGSGTTADSLATATVTYAAPTVSVPVIAGTAQEGQTLTASATAGSGDTLSYAWFAGATQVGSGASYVVKEADEASTITVQATATNGNNVSASQTSAPSSSVIDIAPALSVPVIAGTAQEGQTLTASAAAANDADATVGYQWQSSADGTSWSPIAGATSLSYQVAAADAGKMLRVEATSSDPDGSGTTADSLATPTVTYAAPTVSVPVIGGTAQEGQTLTASAAAGSGDTLSYAWFAGATQVGSGASYVVKEADEASTITVQATATNRNNVSASQTSAPSSSVIDIAPALSVPVIAGTAQEGQTLTASAAAANDADATVGYQWQSSADGTSWSPIAGATSLSYQVAAADAGKMLRVEATSSDPDGSGTTADSLATPTVTYAAPTVSVPVIGGTAQEGQTLTASATAGSGDTLSYAWFAGATQVGSGASYVVKEADEASTITVQATATNGNNVSASQTSAPSSSVIDIAPALSVPVIAGTAQEGQTLTASAAAANDADATVGYQWQSSADGTSWSPIAGATSLSYQVAAADAGKMLRVEATSSDPDGSGTTADSLATATVTYAAPTVSVPVIAGTAQEGQTLTASAAAGSGDTLSYAWFAGATQVGSGASYVVKEADEASTITVQATATNGNNVSASQTSAPSSSVIDIAPALSVPVIAGTAQEGQTLTASAAAANDADATVGYQWQSSADGTSWSPIAGATSLSYQVAAADAGKMLRVEATSSDPDGSGTTADSLATPTVTYAAPTVSVPVIGGTAQEGQTLTASATAGSGDTLSYAWFAGATQVGSGASYVVKEADEASTITVQATATNGNNVSASQTSAPSSSVIDIAPALSVPVIAGTAQEGQTLTASAAAANDADATVGYQWQSSADGTSWSPIAGATSLSYQVAAADAGKMLRVEATSSDPDGSGTTADSLATPTVTYAAPTVSVPVIGGTAQEGQTLTASAAAGSGDTLSYAWFAGATQVGSGASYVVQEADEASTITVQATATNRNNVSASQTSAPSSSVIDIAPALSVPVIAGTAQEGQTLTASAAAANDADATVGYQWQSSADGTSWSPIAGATSLSYQVAAADAGKMLRVEATSSDPDGSGTTADSLATPTVTYAAPMVSVPVIGGTAQEGQTLTASATAGSGDTLSYAWFAGATQVGSGASYVVKEADEASTITVQATATNGNNVSASQTSAPSSSVIDIAPALSVPVIAGTAQEGQTLTASATAGSADNAVTYQWLDNGTPIAGATGSTYVLRESDQGAQVSIRATATNDNGASVSRVSQATLAVKEAALAFTAPVSISGTAQEGTTLLAVNGTLTDGDPAIAYQWQWAGTGPTWFNISGATGATYTPVESGEGLRLRVVETASDPDGGPTVVSASAASLPIIDVVLAFTAPASITGTAQEGSLLTAVRGTLTDSDAGVAYQWQRAGSAAGTWSNIGGATATTYRPVEADEGSVLRVVETATDADGGPATTSISNPTAAVADITLGFSAAASISGTVREGSVLTAAGTANDSDATIAYQWQWSSDGATWSPIAGATARTYTLTQADEANRLRVVETATDLDGGPAVTSTSASTAPVADILLGFSTAASISGIGREGSILTASGGVNDGDATIGYQWQSSNGTTWSNVAGATGKTYVLGEGDEGLRFRVVETAADPDASPSSVTSTSASTGVIADLVLAFTSPATIAGGAREGAPLSAGNGALNDSDGSIAAYQWQSSANGGATWSNIAGATSAAYTPTEADEGKVMRVVETATDTDGGPSVTSTSGATGQVAESLTEQAAISLSGLTGGNASEAHAVTATVTDIDAPTSGIAYTWQASTDGTNWTSVGSATGGKTATFTPTVAIDGQMLRVAISFTDTHGFAESGTASAGTVTPTPTPPAGFSFSPSTAFLAALEQSGGLAGGTTVGTLSQSGGVSGHAFTYALAGSSSSSFALASNANQGTLSTAAGGAIGAANGQLDSLTVQVNDITNGTNSGPLPLDLVIGSAAGDVVHLASGAGNLGLAPATPTFVLGLDGSDTIDATGMTGPVWFAGGAGADTMTGGSGSNTYLYGAASESTTGGTDVITNFRTALDKLDFTGLGANPLSFLSSQLGSSVAPNSIGWKQVGSGASANTFVYVNTSGAAEALGAANMTIELNHALALTAANFVHH